MFNGVSRNVGLGSFDVNFPPKNRAANVSLNADIQECVEGVLYFGVITKVSLLIQPRVLNPKLDKPEESLCLLSVHPVF